MKQTYNKKIFMGQVVDILDKTTPTGKFLVEFRARSEDEKLYVCTIWEREAEKFFSEVKVGDKVHLEGVEKSDLELTIKYFKGNEAQAGRKVSGPSEAEIEAHRAIRRSQGFEFVKIPKENGFMTIAKPRKDCIKVNGVWEGKMEYCLRVLGGKYVTEALRDFGDPKNPGTLVNSVNPISFKKILEELVVYTIAITEDTIERAEEEAILASIPEEEEEESSEELRHHERMDMEPGYKARHLKMLRDRDAMENGIDEP